jgi:hypothetical protein
VERRRTVITVVVVLAALVATVAVLVARSGTNERAQGGPSATSPSEVGSEEPGELGEEPGEEGEEGEEEGHTGADEAREQEESTAERLEALDAAVADGSFGAAEPFLATPAPGWSGEQVIDATVDDWEPAIAADPNDPFVYLLTTRYGTAKPCPGNCPTPFISLTISKDGGMTWGNPKPLCACKGGGQYDPIIEVVPDTGAVYALYMNGFNVMFVRSTDHGRTWSDPVPTYGNVSWNDKPVLAMSDDGKDVYASWNGPTGGDPWLVQSHDRGRTWTQTKLVRSTTYYFAFDADVAPDGTVYLAESEIDYASGSGQSGATNGTVVHHVFLSRNQGRTWHDVVVDNVAVGLPCTAAGCSSDFYIGHDALSVDDDGDIVVLYDGATRDQGPQRIFARSSSDAGRSWSARTAISRKGETATAPAVEMVGDGDVRAFYYETANDVDVDAWNVWYRTSTDGGRTWEPAVKISDATEGAKYKHADGFEEVYGDYGEMAVTSAGAAIAAWGEGFSWIGPGGVWVNVQV